MIAIQYWTTGHHGPGWYSWDTEDCHGSVWFDHEPTSGELLATWGRL